MNTITRTFLVPKSGNLFECEISYEIPNDSEEYFEMYKLFILHATSMLFRHIDVFIRTCRDCMGKTCTEKIRRLKLGIESSKPIQYTGNPDDVCMIDIYLFDYEANSWIFDMPLDDMPLYGWSHVENS